MIIPSCYDQWKSLANTDTYLFQAESSVYGQEFAGFCEDYTGIIPFAYSQWVVSLRQCHISLAMKYKYCNPRSADFSYKATKERRIDVYKDFIDHTLKTGWYRENMLRDRFSQS